MLMCTRPLVVFWWLRKNYWSYRKNNYIFGILTKFYLRKVTSYFTCRAIRGLIFSKLPPIDWSVLRSTIWNGRRYYALRWSVTCQGFSYSLRFVFWIIFIFALFCPFYWFSGPKKGSKISKMGKIGQKWKKFKKQKPNVFLYSYKGPAYQISGWYLEKWKTR